MLNFFLGSDDLSSEMLKKKSLPFDFCQSYGKVTAIIPTELKALSCVGLGKPTAETGLFLFANSDSP